jgi:hypothetical protein
LKKYDPEACKLMDDFYSGRIDIGKAEPRRRRSRADADATNSTPATVSAGIGAKKTQ